MAAIEYRGLNAVTNFDLSRYIKWLRPNQVVNTNSPNLTQANPNPTNMDINQMPSPSHELGLGFLQKQQSTSVSEANLPPARPATASSALGLLLQSSKFKEMLERTSAADCSSTPLESDPPRRSFPDDIQTYFDCHDSSNYADGDENIFGDLNSFSPSTIFQCEIDG